jgi:ABC-2 type transport system permease protein
MPIFDQGYQHWSGGLSGHAWRWLTITRHGVRAGLKNRFLRYLILAAWVPAIALVLVLCFWGLIERKSSAASTLIQFLSFLQPGIITSPRDYRIDIWRLSYFYFLRSELWFSMIMIFLLGPGLISQDLRFNALPLYFSRPLRRIDYFLGKLGVIVVFLALVMIVPSIVAYIMGLAFSLDISIIGDTFGILLASIGYGLIVSLSAGLLMLALSALSRNSRYVALLWAAVWIISSVVSLVLQSVDSEQRRYAYFSKLTPPSEMVRSDSLSRQERTTQMRAWRRARERAYTEYRLGELEFSKKDWRPVVSYMADLSRMGQQLLSTNETWKKLSRFEPDPQSRDRILATYMGPEFPWYWSAAALIGLFGFSACILNLSVKSMDRLK